MKVYIADRSSNLLTKSTYIWPEFSQMRGYWHAVAVFIFGANLIRPLWIMEVNDLTLKWLLPITSQFDQQRNPFISFWVGKQAIA